MKRAMKQKSSLYAYLDSTKVLETGSEQDIVNARKEYWRQYKAEWRRNQRNATKQYTIALTADEAKQITIAAKKHRRSITTFIKESCQAYLNTTYLVPDVVALNEIRQLLAINYNALQKLFDENVIPFQIGRTLVQQMAELEKNVFEKLYHPKEINDVRCDN